MLRRILWTAFLTVATLVARKAATRVWAIVTGETPPGKKR
jgi:hypothetical protein